MSILYYYHNPRCSKSREGLELLQQMLGEPANTHITLEVIDYLKRGFSAEEVNMLVTYLDDEVSSLIRTSEQAYKDKPINCDDRIQVVEAIVNNPKLFQRPVARLGRRALIGRPPQRLSGIVASE